MKDVKSFEELEARRQLTQPVTILVPEELKELAHSIDYFERHGQGVTAQNFDEWRLMFEDLKLNVPALRALLAFAKEPPQALLDSMRASDAKVILYTVTDPKLSGIEINPSHVQTYFSRATVNGTKEAVRRGLREHIPAIDFPHTASLTELTRQRPIVIADIDKYLHTLEVFNELNEVYHIVDYPKPDPKIESLSSVVGALNGELSLLRQTSNDIAITQETHAAYQALHQAELWREEASKESPAILETLEGREQARGVVNRMRHAWAGEAVVGLFHTPPQGKKGPYSVQPMPPSELMSDARSRDYVRNIRELRRNIFHPETTHYSLPPMLSDNQAGRMKHCLHECRNQAKLHSPQWHAIENAVALLTPVEEVTPAHLNYVAAYYEIIAGMHAMLARKALADKGQGTIARKEELHNPLSEIEMHRNVAVHAYRKGKIDTDAICARHCPVSAEDFRRRANSMMDILHIEGERVEPFEAEDMHMPAFANQFRKRSAERGNGEESGAQRLDLVDRVRGGGGTRILHERGEGAAYTRE